ncbi:MAG: helix-turn-helix domain-containing protein [Hamadaea sp.]|uniref:GlxA family transcriptional regulator n=1 Tax=Hamadaea sp. TaxID=2024425 RepID=UPI001851B304|nr:helix-turn-helix domain-containing protein [Hamadaea sp.]NUR69202.1 helix-turn-helix domain-containing protein [Hamadaea sp.]NUT20058.1 helix-turn-helix domain-containing protein [Hamadaea sp.]
MPKTHKVAVLALPGVIPFELGIPSRIFGAADDDGRPRYEVAVCTLDGGPVQTEAGFSITVEHGLELFASADTVVLPPFHPIEAVAPGSPVAARLASALSALPAGTRKVAICTAAYALAACGLLDGRPATTHWHEADDFQRRFPLVKVDAGVLFVDDGDVLTSAGVASGVDLCLHLIRRDHGSEVAALAARRCVVPPWRDGGQAQYVERPVPTESGAGTAATREWALRRLAEPVSLQQLAAHARMSVRTFTRRFRDEVGMTPGQWLIRQRVDRARGLLESTDLPVEQVARQSGFGTALSLRQHLRAVAGVSPADYRRTFRARDVMATDMSVGGITVRP